MFPARPQPNLVALLVPALLSLGGCEDDAAKDTADSGSATGGVESSTGGTGSAAGGAAPAGVGGSGNAGAATAMGGVMASGGTGTGAGDFAGLGGLAAGGTWPDGKLGGNRSTDGGTSGGPASTGGATGGDVGGQPSGAGTGGEGVGDGGTSAGGVGGGAVGSGGTSGGGTVDPGTGGEQSGGGQSGGELALFPGCSAHVQGYNGQRGVDFNDGWKFNLGDVPGGEAATFNDSSWQSLHLPHDWSIETGFSTGGVGWYRKTFTVDAADADLRIYLQFDGVYQESEVWINGQRLGSRPYGYSSFEFELTDHLNFGGENVIAVKVDNSNQPNSRWYSGSGIYRNVWLTKVHPVHFPTYGVVVTSPDVSASSATVAIKAQVQNQSASGAAQTITTTILDPNGVEVAADTSAETSVGANASSEVTQSLTLASPRFWEPDAPNLYQVRVALNVAGETVDTFVVNWGLRTIEVHPNSGFLINGRSLKLQGVNQHHDLGALGAAVNCRAIERQLEILKSIGVNAIRLSHNPHAPEVYDAADRLGILLVDESFDTWTESKTTGDYHRFFNEWAETDIKDMVRRDRNHPSVFAWSIGNEIYGSTTQNAQRLIDWVKAEDDTRLTTWGNNNIGTNRGDAGARQVSGLLDMQGYNYAPYSGDYDSDHAANPNWVVYGSEVASIVSSRGFYITPAEVSRLTGGEDVIRVRDKSEVGITHDFGSDYDNFCMTYSNTAMEAYLYDIERPYSAGMFIWSGFDYIGEPRPFSTKNSYYGIVDTAGFFKNAAYFYQSRWTSIPMVHLLPHWNWSPGETVDVWVYTNCETAVELFLNDVSLGSKTIDLAFPRLEWQVPFEPGTLRAVCTMDGAFEIADEVTTASEPATIRLTVDRSEIRADGRDLAFITADILDSSDVFVATANSSVAFSVSGPGEIVGVDNGNQADTTPFKNTTRAAFSGKVLAIVQSTGEPGPITVSATAAGLSDGEVSFTAQ